MHLLVPARVKLGSWCKSNTAPATVSQGALLHHNHWFYTGKVDRVQVRISQETGHKDASDIGGISEMWTNTILTYQCNAFRRFDSL